MLNGQENKRASLFSVNCNYKKSTKPKRANTWGSLGFPSLCFSPETTHKAREWKGEVERCKVLITCETEVGKLRHVRKSCLYVGSCAVSLFLQDVM